MMYFTDIARISFLLLLLSGTCLADRTADQYRKVFETIDEEWADQINGQTEVLRNSLRQPPCLEASLARTESLIKEIARPTGAQTCDWEVDLSEGLDTRVPHLASLRSITRVILADAERHMIEGNHDLVADRIGMLYRISAHVGPPILLSSLVASAMLLEADDLLDDAIARGMIQPAQAAKILRSMKRLDPEDPAQLISALKAEEQFGLMMLDDLFKDMGSDGPIIDPKDRETIVMLGKAQGIHPEDHDWLFEGKNAIKAKFEEYHSQLLEIWKNRGTKDVESESLKIEQRIMEGEFSQLTMLLAMNLTQAMLRVMDVEEQIQTRTSEIEKLSEGQATIVIPVNAAPIYARAIGLANDSNDDWRRNPVIRDLVINELHLAQLAETCSFPEPEDVPEAFGEAALQWTAPVIPWWLPAMDQFITEFLLISDQEKQAGRRRSEVANLISALNVIQHLIQCSNLSASIVAANRAPLVLDRIRSMEQDGLSPDDAASLLEALRDIPTSDPFGIQAASRRSFRRLNHHLQDLAERNLLPSHELQSNPDELLYFTAFMRDLPAATSLDHDYLGIECQWPDGDSALACPPFSQIAIDAAATDGSQAAEAWTLEVKIPLVSAGDICSTNAQQLVDDARSQLLKLRQLLRQQASR